MIRGTNYEQDSRFSDKSKRMLEQSKWPDKYETKIDMEKVDIGVINIWIEKKVVELLGEQDDIISGTIIELLNEYTQNNEKLNAKKLHIAITGLLLDKTLMFMSDLWDILQEAQKSLHGIPERFIEQKREAGKQDRKQLKELRMKKDKLVTSKFDEMLKKKKDSRSRSDEKEREKQTRRQRASRSSSRKRKNKIHRQRDAKKRDKRRSHRSSPQRYRSRDRKRKEKDSASIKSKSYSSSVVSSSSDS